MMAFPAVSAVGSRSLRSRAIRLDLPLPVRPQMATFSPALIVRSIAQSARLGGVLSVWSSAVLQ